MPRTPVVDPKPEPKAEPGNTLVAAAITMSASIERRKYRKPDQWQADAWRHYDARGPLRYGANWFANALSRATLHAARLDPVKGVVKVTEGPGADAMRDLFGGAEGGQAALLKAMGQHFFVAGEWYLVGRGARDEDDRISTADDVWEIVSTEEMRYRGGKWAIDYGDGDKIDLTDSDVIIRMWNPHPRKRFLADSPVRAALGDLTEIEILTRHIQAQVFSRLAGAGVLAVPTEMTFTKPANSNLPADDINADPFMVSLARTMAAAIDDPGDVAAMVPILVRAPGEWLDKIKHITFWSDLDNRAGTMRDDATRNLAITLDMPPEVLLGTADVNHWGSWQIEESSIKAHIEPALQVIVGCLTTAYLRKVTGDNTLIVAFDTSALRLRPNRSKEAIELFDRGEINGLALRRETGFAEEDAPDDEEFKRWMLRKIASGSATPEMVAAALKLLGVDLGDIEGDKQRQSRPDPSLEDHPVREAPEPIDSEVASLMATCNALAFRALERAGNRLKNTTSSRPPGVHSTELHTLVPVDSAGVERLLEGAWTPLPLLLNGIPVNHARVERALDAYTRSILTTGSRHDSGLMQRFISAALEDA